MGNDSHYLGLNKCTVALFKSHFFVALSFQAVTKLRDLIVRQKIIHTIFMSHYHLLKKCDTEKVRQRRVCRTFCLSRFSRKIGGRVLSCDPSPSTVRRSHFSSHFLCVALSGLILAAPQFPCELHQVSCAASSEDVSLSPPVMSPLSGDGTFCWAVCPRCAAAAFHQTRRVAPLGDAPPRCWELPFAGVPPLRCGERLFTGLRPSVLVQHSQGGGLLSVMRPSGAGNFC